MAMITPTVFPSGVAGICDVLLELLELKQEKKGGEEKRQTMQVKQWVVSKQCFLETMFLGNNDFWKQCVWHWHDTQHTTVHLLDPRIQLLSM